MKEVGTLLRPCYSPRSTLLSEHSPVPGPAVLEKLGTKIRVDRREVGEPVIDVGGVVVRVEVVCLVLPMMVSPVAVRSPVLLSAKYLVHRPEDIVPLPPGTESLARVAGQSEALLLMVVVVTVPANLGVLTQLG